MALRGVKIMPRKRGRITRASYYKHGVTEKQYNVRQEALRRMEKRTRTISAEQMYREKECYPEYVYWKLQLEGSMKRIREFLCRG